MSLACFLLRRLPILFIVGQSHLLYANNIAIEPLMVDIPAGQLIIHPAPSTNNTSANEAANTNIKTEVVRKVTINPFRMGKYEVTVKEFGQFIAATNYPAPASCIQ